MCSPAAARFDRFFFIKKTFHPKKGSHTKKVFFLDVCIALLEFLKCLMYFKATKMVGNI